MLLVVIGMALLGLLVIQVKWMRDTMALREAQFQRSIENALHVVSDRLEQLERMHVLKGHQVGKRLLQKLDDKRNSSGTRSKQNGAGGLIGSGRDTAEGTAVMGEQANAIQVLRSASSEDQEELITDMVRGILAAELVRNINERIDPHLLDSLLLEEFETNGLAGPVHYQVVGEDGSTVELGSDERNTGPVQPGELFREKLFRHDLGGPAHYLVVEMPEQHEEIRRRLLPLLLISALLMGVIIAAFGLTIRNMVKQKRIGEIRTDLVNNLTHELKTPISTIGLACEALSDPSMPKTEDQVRTFVGMIRDENKRLGSLVENVLQSAVLEGGNMVLKQVDLDMHTVVGEVVRSSSMLVARRNGRIDTDLKAEIHNVSGDRTHLTNVLYNLIDNAVKYAEQEPRVRISTTSNDEGITLSVTDNGIGISPSEQRKVFDRLYRVPTGNIHNAKGFGLGLSYVRTVVERHGGRIRLESVPGQGSTFSIFIPFEHVSSTEIVGGRG